MAKWWTGAVTPALLWKSRWCFPLTRRSLLSLAKWPTWSLQDLFWVLPLPHCAWAELGCTVWSWSRCLGSTVGPRCFEVSLTRWRWGLAPSPTSSPQMLSISGTTWAQTDARPSCPPNTPKGGWSSTIKFCPETEHCARWWGRRDRTCTRPVETCFPLTSLSSNRRLTHWGRKESLSCWQRKMLKTKCWDIDVETIQIINYPFYNATMNRVHKRA